MAKQKWKTVEDFKGHGGELGEVFVGILAGFGRILAVLGILGCFVFAGWVLLSGLRWLWEHPLW